MRQASCPPPAYIPRKIAEGPKRFQNPVGIESMSTNSVRPAVTMSQTEQNGHISQPWTDFLRAGFSFSDCLSRTLRPYKKYQNSWMQMLTNTCSLRMSGQVFQRHRTGCRWSPDRSLFTAGCVCMLVAPLWRDLGRCSRTVVVFKAAAKTRL